MNTLDIWFNIELARICEGDVSWKTLETGTEHLKNKRCNRKIARNNIYVVTSASAGNKIGKKSGAVIAEEVTLMKRICHTNAHRQ